MSTINFSEIDCKQSINKENKIINFNGSEIRVLNYLSAQDKYDLIMITLQKSIEDEVYSLVKMKTYFDLHLVMIYTNIVFSAEDRADEIELYDLLNKSGLIKAVREAIGEEAELLWEDLCQNAEYLMSYKMSFENGISTLLEKLMLKITNAIETLKTLDPELMNKLVSTNPSLAAIFNIASPNKE